MSLAVVDNRYAPPAPMVRVYSAQYAHGGRVGFIEGLRVYTGPGESGRAEVMAVMAAPVGAEILGWWPTPPALTFASFR